MPRLRPTGATGEVLELPKGNVHSIGRSEKNTIRLPHRSVSSRHAVVDLTPPEDCPPGASGVVRDVGTDNAGSRFGTFVNDHHLRGAAAPLRHGDAVHFGTAAHGASYIFEDEDMAVPAEGTNTVDGGGSPRRVVGSPRRDASGYARSPVAGVPSHLGLESAFVADDGRQMVVDVPEPGSMLNNAQPMSTMQRQVPRVSPEAQRRAAAAATSPRVSIAYQTPYGIAHYNGDAEAAASTMGAAVNLAPRDSGGAAAVQAMPRVPPQPAPEYEPAPEQPVPSRPPAAPVLPQMPSMAPEFELTDEQRAALQAERSAASEHVRRINQMLAGAVEFDAEALLLSTDRGPSEEELQALAEQAEAALFDRKRRTMGLIIARMKSKAARQMADGLTRWKLLVSTARADERRAEIERDADAARLAMEEAHARQVQEQQLSADEARALLEQQQAELSKNLDDAMNRVDSETSLKRALENDALADADALRRSFASEREEMSATWARERGELVAQHEAERARTETEAAELRERLEAAVSKETQREEAMDELRSRIHAHGEEAAAHSEAHSALQERFAESESSAQERAAAHTAELHSSVSAKEAEVAALHLQLASEAKTERERLREMLAREHSVDRGELERKLGAEAQEEMKEAHAALEQRLAEERAAAEAELRERLQAEHAEAHAAHAERHEAERSALQEQHDALRAALDRSGVELTGYAQSREKLEGELGAATDAAAREAAAKLALERSLHATESQLEDQLKAAEAMGADLRNRVGQNMVQKISQALTARLTQAFGKWKEKTDLDATGGALVKRLMRIRKRTLHRAAMRHWARQTAAFAKAEAATIQEHRVALREARSQSAQRGAALDGVRNAGDWRAALVDQQLVIAALREQLADAQAGWQRELSASAAALASGSGAAAAAATLLPLGGGDLAPKEALQRYVVAKTGEATRAQREAAECRRRLEAARREWSALSADKARLGQQSERERVSALKSRQELIAILSEREARFTDVHTKLLGLVVDGTTGGGVSAAADDPKTARRRKAAEVLRNHIGEMQAQMASIVDRLGAGGGGGGGGAAVPAPAERSTDPATDARIAELSDEVAELRCHGGVLAVVRARERADALELELAGALVRERERAPL